MLEIVTKDPKQDQIRRGGLSRKQQAEDRGAGGSDDDCHLRSMRSAIKAHRSGVSGYTIAMKMNNAGSSRSRCPGMSGGVGTQLLKSVESQRLEDIQARACKCVADRAAEFSPKPEPPRPS